jgi:hypothetical protein
MTTVATNLPARYRDGDYVTAWDEACRNPGTSEAEAVASEMMSRVARNVDVLVERLDAAGFRWADPEYRRRAPDRDDQLAVTAIESALGPLPLALHALLLRVGEVSLCGTHPSWSPPVYAFDDLREYPVMADPLVLPSATWMLAELGEWDADEWNQPKRPWEFAFAPDELAKANISGRAQVIMLPTADQDPVIENVDWHRRHPTLVSYLRAAFGFGGFPGFEFRPPVPPLIEELSRELLPF